VWIFSPPIKFWMPEPVSVELGIYIVAPDPISRAYFINASCQSVCLCVSFIVARQRLSKNFKAATNTQATIE
jgi:hypothetical protein